MKKTRKNMLRSSAAMLLVSALALTTATYAWFTSGNVGKVEAFSLTAEAADGIQLSADAQNWKSTITLTELKAASLTANRFPATVAPLSSAGVTSGGKLNLYMGSVDKDTGVFSATQVDETSTTTNMIRFDLYVKNASSKANELQLDMSSDKSSVTANGTDTGIKNAVRVAFVKQGSVMIGSSDVVTTKTATDATKAVIWEPNTGHATNKTVIAGSEGDTKIYALNSTSVPSGAAISAEGILAYTTATQDCLTEQETFKGTSGSHKIAELGANTLTKFTVYVWIEGQDVDCTNYESNGGINVNLCFKDNSTT